MPSRQRYFDEPLPRRVERDHGDGWTLLFVLALAAFLGSLLILAQTILQEVGRASAGSPRVALTEATRQAGATPAARAPSTGELPVLGVSQAAAPSPDSGLRAAIESAVGDDADHAAVAVYRLSDGKSASVDGGRVFYAASTFKLAVLYEAERQRSAGTLDFNASVYLNDEDISEDLGTLGDIPMEADGSVQIAAALEAMITRSDNATAVALLHLLGAERIDQTLRELGLSQTSVNTRDLPTTADDLALLMRAIVEGTGVTDEARLEMRKLLLGQLTREGIPRGLPSDVPVGNKTGTWENATHDVAFVEAPGGTYVIVVLVDTGWEWGAAQRVSRAVFEALSKGT